MTTLDNWTNIPVGLTWNDFNEVCRAIGGNFVTQIYSFFTEFQIGEKTVDVCSGPCTDNHPIENKHHTNTVSSYHNEHHSTGKSQKKCSVNRIQIHDKSFIRLINNPSKPVGTILILEGGPIHFKPEPYYVTMMRLKLKEYRIYAFEHLDPVIGLNMATPIDHALKTIRHLHTGTLILTGFSIGGMLVWNYLSEGYDSADGYVPISCPVNLRRFYDLIPSNFYCRRLYRKLLSMYNVNTNIDLLKTLDIDPDQFLIKLDLTYYNLTQKQSWKHKLIWVFGENDSLLESHEHDLKEVQDIKVKKIPQGTHCCINTTIAACDAIKTLTPRS
jgi:pimeloyl-ACP methyl ester carboxylesterase